MSDLSAKAQAVIAEQAALAEKYPDSEIRQVPADGDYDHRLVKESLLRAIVCTRKTDAEAAEWLTTVRPPGTQNNRWFASADAEPVPCQDRPETHRHIVVEC